MAKGDKLNENLREGEKLIGMSAKSAKKFNKSILDSAGSLQELLNTLMGISDELEESEDKMGYFEKGFKKKHKLCKSLN